CLGRCARADGWLTSRQAPAGQGQRKARAAREGWSRIQKNSTMSLREILAVVKWRLVQLSGDFSTIKTKLSLWFSEHIKGIGMALEVFLLAWVLLRFPTVKLWTVLVIVLCVVSMAFQIGIYLLIKTIESFLHA